MDAYKLRSVTKDLFSEFIVRKLELFSCQVRADHGWVFQAFLSVGVPLPKLLDTYNK